MARVGMKYFENRPYIIAEIGANHNGDIELAKKMIEEIKNSGADCVKFQIKIDPFELGTKDYIIDLDNGDVVLENVKTWKDKKNNLHNIFDQINKYHFSKDTYRKLIDFANNLKLDVGASVFTSAGVDFVKKLDLKFIKIASMDVINFHLIDKVIESNLPLIASSGMASSEEIDLFVNYIDSKNYLEKTALLHCVSIYPPKSDILQLKFIEELKKKYNLVIGHSDHTLGIIFSLISIALGAEIIEKHFTLDKQLPGWDHKISVNPEELKELCVMAKEIKKSLGNNKKDISEEELSKRSKFRRSLTTAKNIKKGEIITEENLTYKRPGTGIPVDSFYKVLGKKVKKNIDKDKTLNWEDIDL